MPIRIKKRSTFSNMKEEETCSNIYKRGGDLLDHESGGDLLSRSAKRTKQLDPTGGLGQRVHACLAPRPARGYASQASELGQPPAWGNQKTKKFKNFKK